MRKILLGSAVACISSLVFTACAVATSHGPIRLDIRQIDGKPAACLPASDDTGSDPIQIRGVDVTRQTGPVSPVVTYWALEVPGSAPPVYLKRGECLVYGQTVAGAVVRAAPRALDINKFYSISIVPGGDYGPVYSSAFCVIRQAGAVSALRRRGRRGTRARRQDTERCNGLRVVAYRPRMMTRPRSCRAPLPGFDHGDVGPPRVLDHVLVPFREDPGNADTLPKQRAGPARVAVVRCRARWQRRRRPSNRRSGRSTETRPPACE